MYCIYSMLYLFFSDVCVCGVYVCSMNGLDQLEAVDGARRGIRAYVQEGPAKFISVSTPIVDLIHLLVGTLSHPSL